MRTPVTNDTVKLQPRISFNQPVLEFDFPALHIGVAEYQEGPTGCTVFYLPKGAFAVVDIGSVEVGTINTNLLRTTGQIVHAICLAGGSVYGLEAITGVSAELFAKSGYSREHGDTPGVTGAITHDFDHRNNSIYPDKTLGRAAIEQLSRLHHLSELLDAVCQNMILLHGRQIPRIVCC